jgi:hypothetical protein
MASQSWRGALGQLEHFVVSASLQVHVRALAAAKGHADALEPHQKLVRLSGGRLDLYAAAVAIYPAADALRRGAVAARIEHPVMRLGLRR